MGYTLITGVTSGIGRALCNEFAKAGNDLILIGRRQAAVTQVVRELQEEFPSLIIKSFVVDLAKPTAAREIFDWVEGNDLYVDTLVNNAGIGFVGKYESVNYEKYDLMMQTNMNTVAELMYLFIPMLKEYKGGILNIASNGAFHPGPYTANYYATKAYILHLTKALRMELKGDGVKVVCVCPGATESDFCRKAGKRQIKGSMTAESVAQSAYKGYMRNKSVVIPGFFNKLYMICPEYFRSLAIFYSQQKLSE